MPSLCILGKYDIDNLNASEQAVEYLIYSSRR